MKDRKFLEKQLTGLRSFARHVEQFLEQRVSGGATTPERTSLLCYHCLLRSLRAVHTAEDQQAEPLLEMKNRLAALSEAACSPIVQVKLCDLQQAVARIWTAVTNKLQMWWKP